MRSSSRHYLGIATLAGLLAIGMSPSSAYDGISSDKRPVGINDSIGMTWIGEPIAEFLVESPSVMFSPDGKSFVVVTRRGNLGNNGNDYSLLYFTKGPKEDWVVSPRHLVTLSSTSNSPGIDHVKWLDDSNTVVFIGARGDDAQQLFSLNVRTGKLHQLTRHPTDVLAFDVTPDLGTVAFEARAPMKQSFDEVTKKRGMVINEEPLDYLLTGKTFGNIYAEAPELYVRRPGRRVQKISVPDAESLVMLELALSPDGRRLSVVTNFYEADIPQQWKKYQESFLDMGIIDFYQVVDVDTGKMRPLLDAPIGHSFPGISMVWSSDSRSVIVNSYLPLDTDDATENELRKQTPFKVEIDVETGEMHKVWPGNCELSTWDAHSMTAILRPQSSGYEAFSIGCKEGTVAVQKVAGQWRRIDAARAVAAVEPRVWVEQNMNSPPRLMALNERTGVKTVLLDPNPSFTSLTFTSVEEIDFKGSDGAPWKAGLYLPPRIRAGQRYPLVIQTHGWTPKRFEIDGASSAGYAAQALAGAGMVVVQLPDDFNDATSLAEGPRSMAQYEGIIDELDRRGLIDRQKVGLQAWSRTGYAVRYTLAFSTYPIAAALVVDGMEAGYVQYMLDSKFSTGIYATYDAMNGAVPFGPGLETWLQNSPMFHLDNVHTPVLQFMLGPYSYRNMWESFTGLRRLCKPVEMFYLPKSNHWPLRPLERIAVQGQSVDWFRFWLKNEQDPDPSKFDQYTRWRQLRVLHEVDERNRGRQTITAAPGPTVAGCSRF